MLRTVKLVALGLLFMLAGCNGTRLQTGGYFLFWEMPRQQRPVQVRAGVAALQRDVVIETVNWESQHLPLKGRMRGGRIKVDSIGARGPHVEGIELSGKILSKAEAEGQFEYTRNGQLVMEGGWRLVHQELYRRRMNARRGAEN